MEQLKILMDSETKTNNINITTKQINRRIHVHQLKTLYRRIKEQIEKTNQYRNQNKSNR